MRSIEKQLREAIRAVGSGAEKDLNGLWDDLCAEAVRHLHAAVCVKRAIDHLAKTQTNAAVRDLRDAATDLRIKVAS